MHQEAEATRLTRSEVLRQLADKYPDLVPDGEVIPVKLAELLREKPDSLKKAGLIAASLTEEHPESRPYEIWRSVQSALETGQSGCVKVFLSFKMTDQGKDAAKQLSTSLSALSASKIEVTSALEFEPGKVWPAKIRHAVDEANWFILMLPDKSEDYDWILFETGMFRSRMKLVDRLICIHHPTLDLPSQIAEFEHVEATPAELKKMLASLVFKPDAIPGMSPLNPDCESLLEAEAKKIADSIVPPKQAREVKYHGRVLSLRLKEADRCDAKLLADAGIVGGERFERIFGRDLPPKTFGELVEDVASVDPPDPWIEELCDRIRRAASGKMARPMQSTFTGAEFGRVFRPILHRTDRFSKHGIGEVFHLVFLEDDRVMSPAGIPESVKTIATLVRQAFRFQWEILGQYNRADLSEDDLEALKETMQALEADARASGITKEGVSELLESHFNRADRAQICEMHSVWSTLRREDGTGELDRALQRRDTDAVRTILERLVELSNEYLSIITCEFHKLSKEEVPHRQRS